MKIVNIEHRAKSVIARSGSDVAIPSLYRAELMRSLKKPQSPLITQISKRLLDFSAISLFQHLALALTLPGVLVL